MPKQLQLDMGVGDVHVPSVGASKPAKPVPEPRAAKRKVKAKAKKPLNPNAKKPPAYRIHLRHPGGSSTIIQHRLSADSDDVAAIWIPGTNTLCAYYPIDKSQALSEPQTDDNGRKLVWVQIARTGSWAGHPQGAFTITQQTLDVMARNFHSQRFGRVQWDFDHCSAMPANSGSLPQLGKPAQGWIYDMKRDGDKLYALTEWKPLAKQYIEDDMYQGVSPVINWHFADRTSGKDVGPTITSVALTNLPFITDMERPLAASLGGIPAHTRGIMATTKAEAEAEAQRLGIEQPFCYYSMQTLMSQLKEAFGLHELATCADCRTSLSNLAGHLDAVGGDGSAHHEGVELGKYISKLRDMVGFSLGMSSTEVIQFIDGILDSYMNENDIEDDDTDLSLTQPAPVTVEQPVVESVDQPAATAASIEGATTMADKSVEAPAAAAAPVQPAAEATPAVPQATETAASAVVENQTTAPEATPAASDAAQPGALPSPEVSLLTLQLAEERAANKALQEKIQALSANAVADEDKRLETEVDTTIRVYAQKKGLTAEHRPHLLSLLKSNPDGFHAMYPTVSPDQEHLLLNVTGGGASNPTTPGTRVQADTAPQAPEETPELKEAKRITALGLNGLAKELLDTGKFGFTSAQQEAHSLLTKAQALVISAQA